MLPRMTAPSKPPLRRRVLRVIRAPWYWVQKIVPKRQVEDLSETTEEEREEKAKEEENEELFRFYADKKPPVSPYRAYFEKWSKAEKEGDNKKANEKKDSIKKPSTSVGKQVKELEALATKPFDPVKNATVIDDDGKDGIARCGTLRRSWQYQARIRPRQKVTVPSVFLLNGS
uniref:Uncharacterized protein n=1 Tax=Panagrellus redivivus TaxID=6233 RepID=A0A7E4UMI6_PANRE